VGPVVRLDFPGFISSPMEKCVPTRTIGRGFDNASGLGFWTSHPLHHAHMVNLQSHVKPEPEEPERRTSRAKRGTMSPLLTRRSMLRFYCSDSLRPEMLMFTSIGVLPELATESHVVNRGSL
jgi:hypothetical protein